MVKDLHVINTEQGLYVSLQDVIHMVRFFHNSFPTMTSLNIFDELRTARGEAYDIQGDSSTDNGGAGIDPAHT